MVQPMMAYPRTNHLAKQQVLEPKNSSNLSVLLKSSFFINAKLMDVFQLCINTSEN